jgi:hypothetical protein
LELICDLACLREAASAKAGAWDLVLAALKLTESKMLLIETGHAH